jgi:endonuclease G
MNTQFFTRKSILGCALVLIFASCSKDAIRVQPNNNAPVKAMTLTTTLDQTLLSETFETGTKAAYAAASVTLSSGSWTLDDALIGSLAADLKDGAKSVRIRNSGTVTTNFDITGSSSPMTLTVKHGIYTGDNASTWQLFVAVNGGSYAQVGSTVTSTTSLQTATFTIPAATSFRISIRKASGSSNRINIDDITLTDTSSTTGGGGTGGGTPVPGDDDNMLLGNPSSAVTSTSSPDNYLMDQSYYIESYNSTQGKPNWVSWHIQSSDLGSTPRQDDYRANTALPSGWYQVGSSAYSGSGFDRGHYCPSGDRTSSVAANQATFLMTNMMPQAPNNNEVTWESLEDYTRDLVTGSGDEVYVIAGSYGQGGTGSNGGTTNTINSGHVVVPAYTWKVVVVLSNGNGDLSRVTSSTRVISVIMPNINTINSNWKTYRTSLSAIESATGYSLLSNVPSAVKSALENVVDNQ